MRNVFFRLGLTKLAAATSLLPIAVMSLPTPADIRSPPASVAHAALPQGDAKDDMLSTSEATFAVNRSAKVDFSRRPARQAPAQVGASLSLLAPHDPALPMLAFLEGAKEPAATGLPAAFVTTAATAEARAARLPQAKPEIEWPAAPPPAPAAGPSDSLLAYAPPRQEAAAPFDALMGGLRREVLPDNIDANASLPRPRPPEAVVRDWLDGRSVGQFAGGQHTWVMNPLPASVHDAKQQKCLAEGVYFEARGESELGQAAVAQVILNRVRNPAYPDTICAVVYQNKTMRNACQFSFACDGVADRVYSKRAWRIAQRIARDATDGEIWLEEVGDSTHYYANYVRPRWGRSMIQADTIGAHIFLRTRNGGWS